LLRLLELQALLKADFSNKFSLEAMADTTVKVYRKAIINNKKLAKEG
jgi:hypothetical protein